MKHALILSVVLLAACASVPVVNPDVPEGAEVGAAVSKLTLIRWLGYVILDLVKNTKINVDIKIDETKEHEK